MEFLHLQCGTIMTLISSDDCTLQCGSRIVTVNSPSGSTMQCDTWLWDDMPLNSPKRLPSWNSTSGFHFHTSPQSTCHSVPVWGILSKSVHPWQKKWRVSQNSQPSWIGFFEKPSSAYITSYRSSIDTIALNSLVFEKIAFFCILATDTQTDRQTDGHHRCVQLNKYC